MPHKNKVLLLYQSYNYQPSRNLLTEHLPFPAFWAKQCLKANKEERILIMPLWAISNISHFHFSFCKTEMPMFEQAKNLTNVSLTN